ncbi:MAG: glycosylase, partial [Planctomycetaceae bacterium]
DLPVLSIAFEPVSDNPVFSAADGKWDTKIRERGWILKDATGWKLWYTGYDPSQQPASMSLGLATSSDGIAWKRSSEQPIVGDFWIEDIMIVKVGDEFFMFAEGAEDQSQLLKSADGVHWDRIGTLDVRLTNGQPIPTGPFGTPTAFFEDGVWNLFYERRDAGIWLARSTDMKTWTNVADEPLLLPGLDQFDARMIAMNQVIRIGDTYVAVLHGTGSPEKPRQWCTYLATSRDLRHWTKDLRGPLRPISENKSSGQLVHDGHQWRLYTMHDKVELHLPLAKP